MASIARQSARAYHTEAVKEYFDQLSGLMGREIAPGEILPKWKPHESFKWAYPVPGCSFILQSTSSHRVMLANARPRSKSYATAPTWGPLADQVFNRWATYFASTIWASCNTGARNWVPGRAMRR